LGHKREEVVRDCRKFWAKREDVVRDCRKFWAKREDVVRDCIKLHNEKLHAINSPNITKMVKSRRASFPGHLIRMGRNRNAYIMLVCKPEWNRPLEKHMNKWEFNIKAC
jgi:hypothetical protein